MKKKIKNLKSIIETWKFVVFYYDSMSLIVCPQGELRNISLSARHKRKRKHNKKESHSVIQLIRHLNLICALVDISRTSNSSLFASGFRCFFFLSRVRTGERQLFEFIQFWKRKREKRRKLFLDAIKIKKVCCEVFRFSCLSTDKFIWKME